MNPSEIYMKPKILDGQEQLAAMDYSSYFAPASQPYHFMGLPPTPVGINADEFNNGSSQVSPSDVCDFWHINKALGRF
jgi:hypothetical protein